METLSRLVTESLARHGFDRPLDYRRLQWSHWFRCESHHSLLIVPSKPGVFAIAEEVMDLGDDKGEKADSPLPRPEESCVGTDPLVRPARLTLSEAKGKVSAPEAESRKPEADIPRRMLAVAQFFEDDDMAFVLDRMLSHENPMRHRLISGRYFVRFVVIEDPFQRRSICNALNQWIVSSAEKATGIGSHFATSLELTPQPPNEGTAHASDHTDSTRIQNAGNEGRVTTTHRLNSAIATTIHCSSSFPSGF